MAHADRFGTADVTLPWLTPDGPLVTVPLFFAGGAGGVLYRSTFNCTWRTALKAAGAEPGRENGMHALRHHYASVMLAGGVDIRALSEFLGHHDPGFTLRVYAHLVPDAVDRARLAVSAARAARSDAPDGPATAQGVS